MLDIVFNLGSLAFQAYTAFAEEEYESEASALGVGGVLAVGAGAFIHGLFSEEEQNDSEEEILNLLISRLKFAKVCVSLWAHCSFADGEFTEEEDELTDQLIGSLFADNSLFPEELADQEAVCEELVNTFNDPLPIKSVVELAQTNDKLAANFYEEACLIFAIDGTVETDEREFLDDLADELKLSRMDKKSIERKHLKLASS